MKLSSENVHAVVRDCMYPKGTTLEDVRDHAKLVEGLTTNFGFDKEKLKAHRSDIISLLSQLPEAFKADASHGGASFLMACYDIQGEQWGEHQDMEVLFCLGMAIDVVQCPFPRSIWAMLPGGMPYFIFNDDRC